MKSLIQNRLVKAALHILYFLAFTVTLVSGAILLYSAANPVYNPGKPSTGEYDISLYDGPLQMDIDNIVKLCTGDPFDSDIIAGYPDEGYMDEYTYERNEFEKMYSLGNREHTSFRFIAVQKAANTVLMTNILDANPTKNYWDIMQKECHDYLRIENADHDLVIYAGISNPLVSGDTYDYIHYTFLLQRTMYSIGLPFLLVCLPLTALLFILLCLAAGRKAGEAGVVLTAFDRFPIEAVLFMLGGGFLVVFSISMFLAQYNNYSPLDAFFNTAALVMIYLSGYTALMVLFTSLVKRIKTHSLLKRSLIYRFLRLIINGIAYIFRHIRLGLKVLLLSGAAAAALDFLFLIFWEDSSGFTLLLILLFELALVLLVTLYAIGLQKLSKGAQKIAEGDLDHHVDSSRMLPGIKALGESMNRIGDGMTTALEERMKSEMLKTELITNVSHDIKTPLTSIINYVDLLKKENIADPKQREYLSILDNKSQRLKILIEDLVEASKASTGNLQLSWGKVGLKELVLQASGEFSEKLKARDLTLSLNLPDKPVYIYADGRYVWRVVENLFSNAVKYSLSRTRVYVDLNVQDGRAQFMIRNISSEPLNFSAEELIERFFRGDRSRGTEGSGLGLSIAKSLTEMQKGSFSLSIDGDLFKAIAEFKLYTPGQEEKES